MASTSKLPSTKTTSRNPATVAPAVIKQLLKCEEHLKVFGKEIQIVNLVVRVRNVKGSQFKNTFIIQDITGVMTAVQWHSGEEKEYEHLICDTHVQVFGRLMKKHKRNILNVFKILPLEDVNLITFHYLRCIDNKLKFEKFKDDNDSTQFSDASSIENTADGTMNAHQKKVLNMIKGVDLEFGLSRDVIHIAVEDELSKSEADEILDWLCAEGYLYTTVNDHHYKATDSWTFENNM